MSFRFDDDVTLFRDGVEIKLNATMQSTKQAFAKFDADVEEGDEFSSPGFPDIFLVQKVERHRGPRGEHDEMSHTVINLASKRERERELKSR